MPRAATRTGAGACALRSIGVGSAAGFGALLSGLVALVRGVIALVAFGVRLGRVGFFDTWATGALYAGRSLIGLVIVVLVAAVIGAITWAIGALLYNWVAGAMGGIKVTLE